MSKAKKIILATIIFVIAAAITVVSVFIGINWGDQTGFDLALVKTIPLFFD